MSGSVWNPMAIDYLSTTNTYDAPEDGISDLAIDAAEMGGTRLCRFFKESNTCYKGQNCEFLHVYTGAGHPSVKTEALPLTAVFNERRWPKFGVKVVLQSTSISSPSFFYCVLPFGSRSIHGLKPETHNILRQVEDLTTEMTAYYSADKTHKRSSSLFYAGEAVAVECSADSRYYRARIQDEVTSLGEKNSKRHNVMYLDFGSTECVELIKIRPLEPKFLQMPFQSIECSLSGLAPGRGEKAWSRKAIDTFKELLTGKYLLALVKSDDRKDVLEVDVWADGRDVGQALVDAGLATRAKTTSGAVGSTFPG